MESKTEEVCEKKVQTPPRDDKGHFIGKTDAGQQEDPSVVKIKIVKEKKPRKPKSIVGKLNDLKEKNASKFLESVISNEPSRILIDGKKYYCEKYVRQLQEDLEQAEEQEMQSLDSLKEINVGMEKLLATMENAETVLVEKDRTATFWRSLAIGLLAGFVIAWATAYAKVYVAELEKNNPPAQVTTEVK